LTDVIANNLVANRDDLRLMTFTTIIRAALAKGLPYVAIDTESGKVVGTACWYPTGVDFLTEVIPGSKMLTVLSEEQQEKSGAADFFATLEEEEPVIHKWWMNTVRGYHQLQSIPGFHSS
ncbi:hypothetical protein L218DRAFT_880518, partial [Marasmius fiardii PR-910]